MLTSQQFRSMIVLDSHVDTILRYVDLGHDLVGDGSPGYMDLTSAAAGNLSGAFFACCVEPEYVAAGRGPERLEKLLNGIGSFVSRNASRAGIAHGTSDILRLHGEDKFVVLPCIEGAQAIGNDLQRLSHFREAGVTYISLTHFASNAWADSSTYQEVHGGLSTLGRSAIAEMNRLGIAVDVSHISDAAFWQTLDVSRAPVFASHSSARSLVPHPRNLTDDMMRALARQRGLIGITWWPEYISSKYRVELEQLAFHEVKDSGSRESAIARLLKEAGDNPLRKYEVLTDCKVSFPDLDDVVAHILHAIDVVGVDCVCIGSDHGAVNFRITGLANCSEIDALAYRLSESGLSADEIGKIFGGNLLRYFSDADQV